MQNQTGLVQRYRYITQLNKIIFIYSQNKISE